MVEVFYVIMTQGLLVFAIYFIFLHLTSTHNSQMQ